MAQKEETLFKNRIRPKLESLPHTWIEKIQQVCILGTPDFIMCIRGIFVALELKTDIGKTSAMQKLKGSRISKAGGVFIVVSPDNWEYTYDLLKSISQKGLKAITKETAP